MLNVLYIKIYVYIVSKKEEEEGIPVAIRYQEFWLALLHHAKHQNIWQILLVLFCPFLVDLAYSYL